MRRKERTPDGLETFVHPIPVQLCALVEASQVYSVCERSRKSYRVVYKARKVNRTSCERDWVSEEVCGALQQIAY